MVIRRVLLFCVVSALHFALSVAGLVLALPAAFDAQAGFWSAPVKISVVWIAAFLLSPLALVPSIRAAPGDIGYAEVAALSVLFGLAAVAFAHAASRLRRGPRR